MLYPSLGQENQDKISKLEQLEEQTAKSTTPDTVVLDEEYVTDRETNVQGPDTIVTEEDNNATSVKLGRRIVIQDTDDSVKIKVGEREMVINDEGDNTSVDFRNYRKERRSRQFQGHIGGMELGYNSFLNGDYGTSIDPAYSYLNLNTTKSTFFNIYSPNVSLGITRHFGLVSAIGFNFNNYRFEGNNTISTDADGNLINPVALYDFEKSKLSTIYAVLPVLIEAQIPVSKGSSVNIGAGVVGAIKLGSHTKVAYYDDGKQKDKVYDDFSLNLLRYGVTARLGYEMVQVFGTCYLSEMFEHGKGPVLHPFEVGIALTIND